MRPRANGLLFVLEYLTLYSQQGKILLSGDTKFHMYFMPKEKRETPHA